jgi:uncharacterized Ntn-hydrolase superfamily protein
LTFSILAWDERTRMLGVALGSAEPLSTSVAYELAPGVGIAITQGTADQGMALAVISRLATGTIPETATRDLLQADPGRERRQLLVIDAAGNTAAFTGRRCAASFGQIEGRDHVTAGEAMASPNVIGAMSLSFERSGGDPLWERLLLALESGHRAGGDHNGTFAAALFVLGAESEQMVDVRLDDHPDAVGELRRLLTLSRPADL